MAFTIANLVFVDQTDPATAVVWRYSTMDSIATVEGTSPKYFAAAQGMMRTGDMLGVTADDAKRMYNIGDQSVTLQRRAEVDSFSWD